MNHALDSFAMWLADYYLLSTTLLALVVLALSLVRQPVQRLAVVKSTLVALSLLAALVALPGWSVIHLRSEGRAAPRPGSASPSPQPSGNEYPVLSTALEAAPKITPELMTESSQQHANAADPVLIRFPVTWKSTLFAVHLFGAGCVVIWLSLGFAAARRLRKTALPASSALQSLFAEVAKRRDHTAPPAELLTSDRIDVAVAIGVLRPAILLPESWTRSQSPDELRMILAHEWAHICNRDLQWLAANRILLIALWAQPLYWILRRVMRLAQEALADAAAAEITTRQRYAEQLVAWARDVAVRPSLRLSSAVGLWEGPSQLRRRVGVLLNDRFTVFRNCPRHWRLAATLLFVFLAAVLSTVTLQPAIRAAGQAKPERENGSDELALPDTNASPTNENKPTATNASQPKNETSIRDSNANRVDMPIVAAQHVLLLNGKQIITWEQIEAKIAALPNPTLAYPHLYVTNGAHEAGVSEAANERVDQLHRKFNLKGHSLGSLSPRTDVRYDRINNESDLKPDEKLRMEGTVTDQQGKPIAGAEVVLITPVDDSIPYKTVDIALVEGRLRNRLEEVVTDTDAQGRFVIYPPPPSGPGGPKYYVVAMHPNVGFVVSPGLTDLPIEPKNRLSLVPWASLVTTLEPEEGSKQSVSLRSRVREQQTHYRDQNGREEVVRGGYPEVVFTQYWVDLNRQAETNFTFKHVPPLMETGISRDIDQSDGGMTSVATASVNLLPGETREIGLGALSDKQREFLEWQQKESEKRLNEYRHGEGSGNMLAPVRVTPVVQRISAEKENKAERPPALLSYGDGKPDGKKSYGGSGHLIQFELPKGVTKVRGIRIHGSRYGLPEAPKEDFEITFLNDKLDETLHTEAAPYNLFKRGKENWVRVMFDKEVELPKKFWIAVNFNPHQTKGVYLSYDTSTKGKYSRVGLPGDEEELKETDFGGDWMVQVMLAKPEK